ncbi:MAG: phosphatase PAP2 family protein [Candidatus Heimdallarchaeum endolithica]|uniref:Phosphatase PAP2 family protein n=1 Tax=Candidatus Heimdallarchaeum endolithica TaxID=2876572 RepID=A0A9Y1FN44_9ARCH|nr:MAG: phosphatase PAP2 family protein [Candidatus Heimdallarchaeum endolithica]
MKLKHWISLFLLLLGSSLIVAALTIVYSTYPVRNNIDQSITNYFYSNRNDAISLIFYIITHLGEELVYIGVITILYYTWDKSKAYKIMAVVLSSAVVNGIFKYSFKLERPSQEFWYKGAEETSPGLPSGHTQIATSFWGSFASIVKKWWVYVLSVLLVLLIGLSRIILSVHWFTDVIMGLGLGLIILALFVEFEDTITSYVNSLATRYKIMLSFLVFIFLIIPVVIVLPSNLMVGDNQVFPLLDMLKLVTLFSTATLSYAVEKDLINFNSKPDKWWKYIIRIIIGVVMLFLFYFGLKELFKLIIQSVTWTGIKPTLDLIRYGLLGPVLILLSPWIMKKIGV